MLAMNSANHDSLCHVGAGLTRSGASLRIGRGGHALAVAIVKGS